MALVLYKLSGARSQVSSDLSYDNPILWEASTRGGTLENRYYLRNDTEGTYATNVRISALDASGADESDWYSFALFSFAPDNGGSPGEYSESIEDLTVPDGGEVPFWIKVEIPQAVEVGPKTDIRVHITGIILESL